jgi:ABC-type lipoprotein export system ATPase subunit
VKEYTKTVLMVTHDPLVAQRADLTLHLEKGLLVESNENRTRENQPVSSGGAA